MLQHGGELRRALETYIVLSIGDGRATVIPALMISIQGGLIVTRAGGVGAIAAATGNPTLSEDLVPKLLLLSAVQRVLQNLSQERVSIRDSGSILEGLGQAANLTKNPVLLTEFLRQCIRRLVVRLAATQGPRAHQPTLLVLLDNLRVGGAEQLRRCAAIFGVGSESRESALCLPQTLSERSNRDLVLIDTPGCGPKEMEETAELAPSMASEPGMDIHLIVAAAMNPADLIRAVGRFEVFRPSKLVFTHRDQTESYGTIWNEAARTGKALSFLATGQPVPEDLEAATRDRILNLVLGPPDERVRAAA